jgi:Tfp pilus assembly protein PilF
MNGGKNWIPAAEKPRMRLGYGDAEKLYVDALKEAELFGPDDPRVVVTLNNFEIFYIDQGKYTTGDALIKRAQAIAEKLKHLYRRALVIVESSFGGDHPAVGTVLNNLAHLYSREGKGEAAEVSYKRALSIRERALGPNHPAVADTLKDYSALLRRNKRIIEAAALEDRAKMIQLGQEQNPQK